MSGALWATQQSPMKRSLLCLPVFPPQSQTSILEGLPHHDLRRFGTLVSAVVTKSWPRHSGTAVTDLGPVLKHLLTSPDIKHTFKLCGAFRGVRADV